MQSTFSRHITALVSLLVFMLAGQTSVQGYVWCLGEDGHAALESAQDTACAKNEGQLPDCHDAEILCTSLDDEHCGPCLDLSISLEATSGRNLDQRQVLNAPLLTAALSPGYPMFIRLLPGDPRPTSPPSANQTLLVHRTVVLLN